MDRIEFKLRLHPELIAKMKRIHPAYGECSKVVGELLEAYVRVAEGQSVGRQQVYAEAIASRK